MCITQMAGLSFVTSKATCIERTNGAFVRAVAGFAAAFVTYRGLYSRAVASVVALQFERALAIGAVVLTDTRTLFVGRAAAFAASGLITFGCWESRCSAAAAHTNLHPLPSCRCPDYLNSVQYSGQPGCWVRCD